MDVSDEFLAVAAVSYEHQPVHSHTYTYGCRARLLAGREREHGELVEYIEIEKSLKEQERERRDAPLWKRAQWFVFGRS